jgi:RNA polymerase sigma-70 factor (ECF subfamily)
VAHRDPLADPEPLIRRVYAYVAYRVGDGPDAEDITSATLERALRYRDRFDPRRGDAAAWLVGIARRCISEHFGERPIPIESIPEEAAPGELAVDSALRLDLRQAVSLLGSRDRELIALRYGADLTARQIGDVLDVKTNAVEVALHRSDREHRPGAQRTGAARRQGQGRRLGGKTGTSLGTLVGAGAARPG